MKNRQIELQILQIEDKIQRLNLQKEFYENLMNERSYLDGKDSTTRTTRTED